MRHVSEAAHTLNLDFFVIGAAARDALLWHVHGIERTRATKDVDFAVGVADWNAFSQLKQALLATGDFEPGNQDHRLVYKKSLIYPLDLVPFDGVEQNGEIAWPPAGDFVMNVAGYKDAFESSLLVEVEPGFSVRVASIPAIAILKILAWNDKPSNDKHATDILYLMRNYHQAGQQDRFYTDGLDLMETAGYDVELAGAGLLARDAKRDVQLDTCAQVVRILTTEPRKKYRFLGQMSHRSALPPENIEALFDIFLKTLSS
ncbi:nucleotidyl transferase AbiEii/AbiGii toxin family protein [Massilia solisilvae]|uniref:Nucleotidyl transferase AbiEii/AbiGii toxin family protein n=1 Tax=Massilia solisilvae TaxID=1811225 RepID=A0ABT2BLK6_9BURK|nr:nucleotidyl transferase AbiEii/AbiGii toxin family protein [Massilia solisilvae]MCS0609394.1 nucleotidyl transferase AbiEii/AbiGii toxin family protein [Massilia solisilvae]